MAHAPVRASSTERSSELKTIPRVRTLNPLSSTLAFQRDPLDFLSTLFQQYGDIVRFRLLTLPIVAINHPEYLKRVLVDNQANYDKDVFFFHVLRPIMGNGLIPNVGGKHWLQQRRMIQPAFHRQRIAALGKLMSDMTLEMLQRWEMNIGQGQPLNAIEEMGRLNLQTVTRALFGTDVDEKAQIFEQALVEINTTLGAFARFPFPPLSVPTPSHLRLRTAIREMNEIVSSIVHRRRQSGRDADDLLSMLLQTVDEETGQGMDSQQLHDEIMNILLGGYETTATALSWVWYLLSQHPAVEQRLHAELDTVLAGRVPTIDDLPQLPYTRMVIDEALRLYPPVWQLMRRAREDDEIDGYHIPANTIISWAPYTVHRHPAFWEHPEQFDPEHFLPERVAERFRYAYIPFGYGPRICIGNNFALTQSQLVLATVAQRYRLVLAPGQTVKPLGFITLRPSNGVPVILERR